MRETKDLTERERRTGIIMTVKERSEGLEIGIEGTGIGGLQLAGNRVLGTKCIPSPVPRTLMPAPH